MKNKKAKEIFWKYLGFANLNILKLPHSLVTSEIYTLEKALDLAIKEVEK